MQKQLCYQCHHSGKCPYTEATTKASRHGSRSAKWLWSLACAHVSSDSLLPPKGYWRALGCSSATALMTHTFACLRMLAWCGRSPHAKDLCIVKSILRNPHCCTRSWEQYKIKLVVIKTLRPLVCQVCCPTEISILMQL